MFEEFKFNGGDIVKYVGPIQKYCNKVGKIIRFDFENAEDCEKDCPYLVVFNHKDDPIWCHEKDLEKVTLRGFY